MVDIAQIKQFNFQYALATQQNLKDINLTVQTGDFITLAGNSGSGKTTLLRQLKKELWPVGKRSGEIIFEGQPLADLSQGLSAQKIGMVFQNPDNQLVMDTVIQELAFSLENIGEKSANIQKRIAELVSFLGFQDLLYASVHDLSGGQKQLVNLASVLILQPDLLLLDEPTAQLDPIATKEFISLLQRVHDELGITVIISEHQLDDILPLSNQLWLMDGGEITYQGPVAGGLAAIWAQPALREFVPDVPHVFLQNELIAPADIAALPLTVVSGKQLIERRQWQLTHTKREIATNDQATILQAKHVSFQYEKNDPYVLDQLNLEVHTGDWLAIVGKNGTGKSTLLKLLIGLLQPRHGAIKLQGKKIGKWAQAELFKTVGYLSQTPSDHFSYDSVRQEFIERARQLKRATPEQVAEEMLAKLGLQTLAERNPQDASGGEQQLIALGIVLLAQPQLLLLDEPTKGLDPIRKRALGELLTRLQAEGLTLIMASHDMAFSARLASQCALLFDGTIVSEEEPYAFFAHNFFYTTTINRMLRSQLPEALNWEEVHA
ncbi:ABC transporter ATP-binding protein [Latilactobacillus curvatus]|uniref:ABC transporter ATP-binding protein n=1 Tax=Latilactobacillus curvatus TaxID=28038 RepID=UPI0020C7C94F|nr:ABC transporter ATP-binding protein [Latilactobacillus curvatus]MCP8861873.1 ABC transporter ATP-binding protein [Latilactobacillus curvatus]MCP8868238.1 ABC transporter ATP-binding protein [Latilactobacillus curvatus]MCP8871780.1 ABC transporter ATP-binding protein [Latilactobacillus curvatus]MCP8880807.1 ABC transporter ATP-binding protein [Latilactobacillus curvatus]